jgi:hypothetical protein
MTADKNIRDELLRQSDADGRRMQELRDNILARDETRVRRMKWIAGICWVVFLISFVLAGLVEVGQRFPIADLTTSEVAALFPEYDWFVPLAIIITQGLFILATAVTFSLLVLSRTLTMHQIQARLSGIEEQLRRIAERERPG